MEDLPFPGQCRSKSALAAAPTSRFRTSLWYLRISRPAHHRRQIISDRSRSTGWFGFPRNLNSPGAGALDRRGQPRRLAGHLQVAEDQFAEGNAPDERASSHEPSKKTETVTGSQTRIPWWDKKGIAG